MLLTIYLQIVTVVVIEQSKLVYVRNTRMAWNVFYLIQVHVELHRLVESICIIYTQGLMKKHSVI